MSPNQEPSVGISCRKCGSGFSRVIETSPRWGRIYRRRECQHCGHRWTTCEVDQELLEARKAAKEEAQQ